MTDCDERVLRAVTFERERIKKEMDEIRTERNRLIADRDAWKIMCGGKQKIIEHIQAERDALQATVDACGELYERAELSDLDANRYRWLRDGNNDLEGLASCRSGEDLDAEIDIAMRSGDGGRSHDPTVAHSHYRHRRESIRAPRNIVGPPDVAHSRLDSVLSWRLVEQTMTLTDLERLARAATPGPWVASDPEDSDGKFAWVDNDKRDFGSMCTVYATSCPESPLANAAYIAALSPERVLALLAVVKAAEAMRERCRYEVAGQLHGAACAFDAALAELEGMK